LFLNQNIRLTFAFKIVFNGLHKKLTPLTGEQLNFVQVESKIKSIDARVNMLIGTGIALFGVLIGIIVRLLTQGHH
jgi:hypothetical protein